MTNKRSVRITSSVLFLLIFLASLVVHSIPGSTIIDAKVANAGGPWVFCNSSTISFCIENVSVKDSAGQSKTYVSSDAMASDGVLVDVSCLSPTEQCLGGPTSTEILKANAESCSSLPTNVLFPVYINAAVINHKDYEVTITLNLGSNEPGYSVGSGIQETEIEQDEGGNWHYTVRTKSVVLTSATWPLSLQNLRGLPGYESAYSEWISTAYADNAWAKSTLTLWPPNFFRWYTNAYTAAGGHKFTWITSKMCDYIPLTGAWFSANANNFEFGIQTSPVQSDIPWYMKFAASAPHFINSSMLDVQPSLGARVPFNGSTIVNPADIKMWVPSAYGTKLGYASALQFQAGIKVTTEDNQQSSPTVTDSSGGYLIDLGIKHYSAPNPSVTFSPGPSFVKPKTITSSLTTSISKAPVVRISHTTSGKSIASFLKLTVASKSTISLRIATSSLKFCKVKGTSIRGVKVGRCKLTISVKPQRGATKSRTISLTVTK